MASELAIEGGTPVRREMLPYSRQWVDEDDIAAVNRVLRSDWLTTGPAVDEFERAFSDFVGVRNAVAVSNGTAALHAAMFALDVGPGDEVIVPTMTFAATANCVVFQGGTPVFADVEPDTLLLDPASVERKITLRTKAIIAVDYAGQPCRYDALREITQRHGLALVADGAHATGGTYKGKPVGSLADLTTFSFHPVKHMTTGEGGMVTTDTPELAARMRRFRNHGITADAQARVETGTFFYEIAEIGYNYRLTDVQCALGSAQLVKLPAWVTRRQEIARGYDNALEELPGVRPLSVRSDVEHAYHLYVVRLDPNLFSAERGGIFSALRAEGIGVNVHYIPVHYHPFYRERFGTGPGLCPRAEAAYECILSLPVFPAMTDEDQQDVIAAFQKVASCFQTDGRR